MTPFWRSSFRATRNLPWLVSPALAVGLVAVAALGAGDALAGTRTHVHHIAAAPLPSTSLVETTAGRGGKKRKGGTRAEGGTRKSPARDAASGKHAGKASKARRGRNRQPEATDDPLPMYRTSHRAGRPGLAASRDIAGADALAVHHGRVHGSRTPVLVDAAGQPLSGARLAKERAHAAALHGNPLSHGRARRNVASEDVASTASARSIAAARQEASEATPAAVARSEAFAGGVAHPDEDDRLPLSAGAQQLASIGPNTPGATSTPQPQPAPASGQVVQGFGAEVAIAPAEAAARPGGTRRRDHPVAPYTLPGAQPAPTLEERAAITEAAVSPAVLPGLYNRNGRLVMPAPLRGSREVLVHQNTMANYDGLERIQDDGMLDRLRADHALVGFPVSGSLHVNDALPYNRRYARPWTVLFAADIAHAFYDRFHQPIQVNSAVRTVLYQARLQRINGNAAATDGDTASPHLTGQAIDLGKRGMNAAELAWMRDYLMPLIGAGKIDVEEEFQQSCFHISVYRRYAGGRTPARELAQSRSAPVPRVVESHTVESLVGINSRDMP